MKLCEEEMSGANVVDTLWQAGYTFDNNNRIASFAPTPQEKTFMPSAATLQYDADNQVSAYNGQAVTHDADGDLLQAPLGGTVLGLVTWDVRHRLAAADGVNYSYDDEDVRTSRSAGGQLTRYVYSRGSLDRLLQTINPDGSITRYVYGLL